jgi:hypothetical protein
MLEFVKPLKFEEMTAEDKKTLDHAVSSLAASEHVGRASLEYACGRASR